MERRSRYVTLSWKQNFWISCIFRPNWGPQTQSLTEPQNVFLHNKVGAFYASQRKNAFRSQAYRTILRPFSNDAICHVTLDNSRDKFFRTGLKAGASELSGLAW